MAKALRCLLGELQAPHWSLPSVLIICYTQDIFVDRFLLWSPVSHITHNAFQLPVDSEVGFGHHSHHLSWISAVIQRISYIAALHSVSTNSTLNLLLTIKINFAYIETCTTSKSWKRTFSSERHRTLGSAGYVTEFGTRALLSRFCAP